jgi:hypothetical protein
MTVLLFVTIFKTEICENSLGKLSVREKENIMI